MGYEFDYIDKKDVLGADVKSGIHATILSGLFLGIDSNGDAVLASNVVGATLCAARGASYADGSHGTSSKIVNDTRASLVRTGKISGYSGLTPGADVYLSSGGGISQVVPTGSGSGYLKQVVGFALAADVIWVDISPAVVL